MHAIYRIYTGNGYYHLWFHEHLCFREIEVGTKHITRDMVGNGNGKHLKSYDTRDQAKKQ